MKGKLSLKSVPGKGTTFYLRIPTEGITLPDFASDSLQSSG